MLATIALAVTAFPASGTYSYAIKTSSGVSATSNVTISQRVDGLATHEVLSTTVPVVTTDQRFDVALRQIAYSGANTGGPHLTIAMTPSAAQLSLLGKTTTILLDHPACVLVMDNILTSSVMLPSVVAATGATTCTFIAPNAATSISATVSATIPHARPARAAASDLTISAQIGNVTETVWYDARTFIPDYIDFGNSGSATLTTTTANTDIPTAAPTPTPFASRFRSRDVQFVSKDGTKLAGTVSYPVGSGPFPAVILIQGSGVSDRNETVGPNQIFAELADGLNARGYAVLRYDKRSKQVARSGAVEDGLAATNFMRASRDVDPKRMYFLGHSEGGEIVLGIALAGAPLRGVIMLAPLPMNYAAIIERQIARNHVTGVMAASLRAAESKPYVASFNSVDPVQEVRKVRLPMLLVHGDEDGNITADDLRPFLAAAKAAHPKTFTYAEIRGDDHLFSKLSPSDAAAEIELATSAPLDPRLIDTLVDWLSSH